MPQICANERNHQRFSAADYAIIYEKNDFPISDSIYKH